MDLKLTYSGGERWGIEGYADADGVTLDHRQAISSFVVLVDGGAVLWSSKKQELVTLSTMEAEYISTTHAAKELIKSVPCMHKAYWYSISFYQVLYSKLFYWSHLLSNRGHDCQHIYKIASSYQIQALHPWSWTSSGLRGSVGVKLYVFHMYVFVWPWLIKPLYVFTHVLVCTVATIVMSQLIYPPNLLLLKTCPLPPIAMTGFPKKTAKGWFGWAKGMSLKINSMLFLRLFNSLSAFGQGSGSSAAFSISKSAPGESMEGVEVSVVSCDVFWVKKLSSELACDLMSCLACWLSLQTFELWFRLLVPPVPTCTSVLQSGQQRVESNVNLFLFLFN